MSFHCINYSIRISIILCFSLNCLRFVLFQDLFSPEFYNKNKIGKDNENNNNYYFNQENNRFVDPIRKKNHLNQLKMNKVEECLTVKKVDYDKLVSDLNKYKEECEYYQREKKIQ